MSSASRPDPAVVRLNARGVQDLRHLVVGTGCAEGLGTASRTRPSSGRPAERRGDHDLPSTPAGYAACGHPVRCRTDLTPEGDDPTPSQPVGDSGVAPCRPGARCRARRLRVATRVGRDRTGLNPGRRREDDEQNDPKEVSPPTPAPRSSSSPGNPARARPVRYPFAASVHRMVFDVSARRPVVCDASGPIRSGGQLASEIASLEPTPLIERRA